MSAHSAAARAHVAHGEHHEPGFVRTYIFSTDHKILAALVLAFVWRTVLVGIRGAPRGSQHARCRGRRTEV